jgi:aryl-alcohol dehydrogenase-like predicted oxidoreductase
MTNAPQANEIPIPFSTATPVRLGATGPLVLPLGLGAMGMSGMYGPTDDAESRRTLTRAFEQALAQAPTGAKLLLDTGDFYGTGHNERLIGSLIQPFREHIVLSVKFGALRAPGGGWVGFDTRPAAVKNFLAYSLDRLGVAQIDIYRPGRLDPNVPIEDTVGAIAEMIAAGYVKHVGLSEVGAETIRRAHAVSPVVDVQIEYSLVSRSPEAAVFPAAAALGVAITAYGVLSRGLLSGSKPTGPTDFRAYLPRFTGDNAEKNRAAVDGLARFARDRGATPSQLAIAWVLARARTQSPWPVIVPVIGARKVHQWDEAVGALPLALDADDLAEIDRLLPPEAISGTRYDAHQMKMLDSER